MELNTEYNMLFIKQFYIAREEFRIHDKIATIE